MSDLIDRFGRAHTSLRVSVTDRCNFRCAYCMPEKGMKFLPRAQVLSYEDLAFVVKIAHGLGISSIRISGGEPLARRELHEFVSLVRNQGVEKIALTTNGLLLKDQAESLKLAGLDRLNISLDSMKSDKFQLITRVPAIRKVWEGIEEAIRVNLSPIKINVLMLEGFNDDEVEGWIEFVRSSEITVRFMELMPMGMDSLNSIGGFLNLSELRERLTIEHSLSPHGEAHVGNGPATYWKAESWKGALGFITPISNSYCGTCSRLRLTCTGQLRACLAYDEHVDLKEAILRRDEDAVTSGFLWAVENKRQGHPWESGVRTETGMSELGG